MINKDITIRAAKVSDAPALLEIYAPYILTTSVTYEYVVPSVKEFEGRIEKTLSFYPYLVAELDGEIVGYAYASRFHPRAAYDWATELSIYLRMDVRGKGIGSALYGKLEELLKAQNIINIYACIAYPPKNDEYLTDASVNYHTHMGYKTVGHFPACACKFDRWYDMVWMEKLLGEHISPAPKVKSFDEIRADFGL